MIEFEGTKGKWQMTTSALECDHNTEVATIWGDSEYGEGATLIAHIDKGAGNEKAISNAQLIAAAPVLLSDLQEAVELFESAYNCMANGDNEGLYNTLANATSRSRFKETINKALGL